MLLRSMTLARGEDPEDGLPQDRDVAPEGVGADVFQIGRELGVQQIRLIDRVRIADQELLLVDVCNLRRTGQAGTELKQLTLLVGPPLDIRWRLGPGTDE
jgi:hypothetical protein